MTDSRTESRDRDAPTNPDGASKRDHEGHGASGLATETPLGDEPAATCAYCGRPFASQEAHDLHVGDRHADACTRAERVAAGDAHERERDSLFYFHLRVVAAIAVLYTVIVLLYMIALGSGLI
jgi:hypothetical protein